MCINTLVLLFFCCEVGSGGFLGNILKGGANFLNKQIFGNRAIGGLQEERELENIGASFLNPGASFLNPGNLGSLLQTFHSVMGAGETVLKTFPVAEIVKTGYELSNSGLLQRPTRGGGKKDATAPPFGGKKN